MFRRWRLKKIHAKFLESCRNLKEGRQCWDETGPLAKWLLQLLAPIPLLGLHDDGRVLLEALDWLEAHCRQTPLGEDVVRRYHRIIYRDNPAASGEYRKHDITMRDSVVKRRAAQKILPMMALLESRLRQEQQRFDGMTPPDDHEVLKLAVDVHYQIGLIHPFEDGNGRVARLSMNHVLRRYGLRYIIYPPLTERLFWDALQERHQGRFDKLVGFAQTCRYGV